MTLSRDKLDLFLKQKEVLLVYVLNNELVSLPQWLEEKPIVPLQISYLFNGAINLLEDKVEADLLFSGEYYRCIFPYNNIAFISSLEGDPLYINESLLPSFQAIVEDNKTNNNESVDNTKKKKPKLKLVKK